MKAAELALAAGAGALCTYWWLRASKRRESAVGATKIAVEHVDWQEPAAGFHKTAPDGQRTDFTHSFSFFTVDQQVKVPGTLSDVPPFDKNIARIPADCILTVTERATGQVETIVLGGNCKTETVGVKEGVWMYPNADFVPIFTKEGDQTKPRGQFNMVKTYDRIGRSVVLSSVNSAKGKSQSDRQRGLVEDVFAVFEIRTPQAKAITLRTTQEMVRAGLAGKILVATTEFRTERYDCTLEYPMKTCNFNDRDWYGQPDTGPILFPSRLDVPLKEIINHCELAFVAWNGYPGAGCGEEHWAEFIVRSPTNITEDVQVQHYSRSYRCKCRNTMYQVDS